MFTILLLILLALLLNRLTGGWLRRGLSYRREISRPVVEIGEKFAVVTTLENRGRLPLSFCRISEVFPEVLRPAADGSAQGPRFVQTLSLSSWERVTRTRQLSCAARGRWILPEATLEVGDLLGLTAYERRVSGTAEVIALPRRLDLDATLEVRGNFSGDHSVRRWLIDDPTLTAGLTEYTGREAQRSIHWPSSLRAGRLLVRRYDFTADQRAMIALNIETAKPFWQKIDPPAVETCLSLCRSIAEELERAGIPYGLATNAWARTREPLRPGLGDRHLRHLLGALGAMDYAAMNGFEETLAALAAGEDRYSTYLVITPAVFPAYLDSLHALELQAPCLRLVSLERRDLEVFGAAVPGGVARGPESS